MPITVREVTRRLDALGQHYNPLDHLSLWRAVLEAIDEGAQDSRLLAREALRADRILIGWKNE